MVEEKQRETDNMSFLFRSSDQTCIFSLVGEGSQPKGYFTLNDEIKYFKGIDAKGDNILVQYADAFKGPTTGNVILTSAPPHVRKVFSNYIPLLESYIPDKCSP